MVALGKQPVLKPKEREPPYKHQIGGVELRLARVKGVLRFEGCVER